MGQAPGDCSRGLGTSPGSGRGPSVETACASALRVYPCPQCHPLSQPTWDLFTAWLALSTPQPASHTCPCLAHTCSSRVPFPSALGQAETVSVCQ